MQQQLIKISLLKNNTGQVEGLPKNPRLIKDQKYAKLKASLEADPEMMELREVIAYDNDGELVVICGNMRLRALKELGVKEVPVKVLPKETPPEKLRAYTIKDNVGFGEDSWDDLANDWDAVELEEWGLELPDLFEGAQEVEAQEDDYESPDIDTVQTDIVPGDLFEIGEHRLLCGDSTDSDAVARLMNGAKADMVFTDPPYNADYKSRGKNELLRAGIKNDNMSDKSFDDFIKAFVATCLLSIKNGASLYFCCNWKDSYPRFFFNLQDAGVNISANIVWNKGSGGMGWQDYRYQYEFIIYGFKTGAKHSWYGGRTETDVWDIGRDHRTDYKHPTQKPVAIPAKAINNSSKSGDLTLDLFLGSGTTMVAAEQLGRKCYGIELDPKYCAVIIDRMIKAFPGIEIKKNGEPYIPEAMS